MKAGLAPFNRLTVKVSHNFKKTVKVIWEYDNKMDTHFTEQVKLLVFTRLESVGSIKYFIQCMPKMLKKCHNLQTLNLSFYGVNSTILKGLNTRLSRTLNEMVKLKHLDIVYFENQMNIINFDWLLKVFSESSRGLERLKIDFYGRILLSSEDTYFIGLCATQVKKEFFLYAPETERLAGKKNLNTLVSLINMNNVIQWITQNDKIRDIVTKLKL